MDSRFLVKVATATPRSRPVLALVFNPRRYSSPLVSFRVRGSANTSLLDAGRNPPSPPRSGVGAHPAEGFTRVSPFKL